VIKSYKYICVKLGKSCLVGLGPCSRIKISMLTAEGRSLHAPRFLWRVELCSRVEGSVLTSLVNIVDNRSKLSKQNF
jgi:hypothetical protein